MNAADYYGLDELKCACSGFIQVKPLLIFYSIQAWEPSPAKVIPAVYLYLNGLTGKLNFRY